MTQKRMYLSKMNTLQECTMKYFFKYHMCIDVRKEPKHFQIGRVFHSMCESYLKENIAASMRLLNIEPLSQEEKDLLVNMFAAPLKIDEKRNFQDILSEMKKNLLSSEALIELPINDEWKWSIKVDGSESESSEEGTWMDEFKTASGYGPSTAAYYHNSPQTWLYLWVLSQRVPNLKGARFSIVTKTKNPLTHVETIHIVKDKMNLAQRAILETVKEATMIENHAFYTRRGSRCKTHFQECEYFPICWVYDPVNETPLDKTSPLYIEEILNTIYIHKDPEEHLQPKV